MDNVVKEIKGVMKHHWGCDEGGATLAMAVRSGLLLGGGDLGADSERGASKLLPGTLGFGAVPVSRAEWVSVMRL